jgi:hypothetical protein
VSLRISRFPEKGTTWVWCHAVHDGTAYTYTEPRLGCTSAKIDPDQAEAVYDAPGAKFSIVRTGHHARCRTFPSQHDFSPIAAKAGPTARALFPCRGAGHLLRAAVRVAAQSF